MSQRKEKYLRRALAQYEGIVKDVDKLNCQMPLLAREVERVGEQVIDQSVTAGKKRNDMERRIRRCIREERRERRNADQVARWALGVAIVDTAVVVGLAVAVLL